MFNGVRFLNQIRMSGFTTVLGIIALITGVGELAGADLPGMAILLILLGAHLVLKPWLEEKKLFGKAEKVHPFRAVEIALAPVMGVRLLDAEVFSLHSGIKRSEVTPTAPEKPQKPPSAANPSQTLRALSPAYL